MSDATQAGPVLAADGTPLKRSLNKALRAQKMRALMLIAPLLIFIMVAFIAPIVDMLFRSVENQITSETLPRTVMALEEWDAEGLPDDDTYAALAYDFQEAAERRLHTRLGSRLNYETTGISSLFRQSGRSVDDIGEDFADQFIALNAAWEEPATWAALMSAPDWLENATGADGPGLPFRLSVAAGEICLKPRTRIAASPAPYRRKTTTTQRRNSPGTPSTWRFIAI